MEDIFKPIECNDDDVIEVGDNTYKVSKIKTGVSQSSNHSLAQRLQQELNNQIIQLPSVEKCFKEGIDCQILTLGSQNWKKGKVKFNLSIEFYIEDDLETTNSNNLNFTEPESPFDDLRRMIHEENS
ncbi:KGK domain-containing protein [Nostoc sp. FACHB-110]|uniref:KGK domain-containing protein n=1 Tax=Nostoc sp. FACHB-110 TaxID=2692834 RepID=UPI0016874FD6|nr:KGK domain-containing protein [Nostoc sp. FACHB-110]MBD2436764.1 KGK family protein [Nostoc sp. FACHB-110]